MKIKKSTNIIISLVIYLILIAPMTAYAASYHPEYGQGKKLNTYGNVTAYRFNLYDQGRVIISYELYDPSAASLQIHHNGKTYTLGVQSSGEIILTEMGGYKIAWYDSAGNRVASIVTIMIDSKINNPTPLPYPEDPNDIEYVSSNAYYASFRDEFRMDYEIPKSPVTHYVLEYMGVDNDSVYTREYYHAPSGIHYLTCNGGYYTIYFYNGSQLVAMTDSHLVNGIKNPTCASYADSGRIDDLGAVWQPGEGLYWNPIVGAGYYEVWRNGSMIGQTQDTFYPAPEPGSYTIIAKDPSGTTIGQSDIINENIEPNYPDPSDPGGGSPGTGCNVCERIPQLLDCPYWDDYMGEWTKAISRAIPTPKDVWDEYMTRLPKISETISKDVADEFERREKPVSPPPPVPKDFDPGVPDMSDYDLTSPINESITDNVPDFTPDFSDSRPFVIPDPLDYEFSDEDMGYMEIDPVEIIDNRPYKADFDPVIQPDIGYDLPAEDPQPGNMPDYKAPDAGEMPAYRPPIMDEDPGDDIPEYQIPDNGSIPDYMEPTFPDHGTSPIYHPPFMRGES